MGTLSAHTPDRDSSLDLIMAMVHDPELEGRFPNHAAFVSSDSPHFSVFVSEAAREGRPVVVAFPGGGYMIVKSKRSADALIGELHLT
jgi:hypothetical protein